MEGSAHTSICIKCKEDWGANRTLRGSCTDRSILSIFMSSLSYVLIPCDWWSPVLFCAFTSPVAPHVIYCMILLMAPSCVSTPEGTRSNELQGLLSRDLSWLAAELADHSSSGSPPGRPKRTLTDDNALGQLKGTWQKDGSRQRRNMEFYSSIWISTTRPCYSLDKEIIEIIQCTVISRATLLEEG